MNLKKNVRGILFSKKHVAIFGIVLLTNFSALAESKNVEALCAQTKQCCDEMHAAKSEAEQKNLAAEALDCATRAVKSGPNVAKAHLCLAVAYVKNFPFVDLRTQVNFSRLIKTEAETAVKLEPTNDISYYLLGRWHYGVANMNVLAKGFVKIVYGGLPKASNELAIENFKKAIALAPGHIINHEQLAVTFHATGQNELALAELKKCATLKPMDQDDADAKANAANELKSNQWP